MNDQQGISNPSNPDERRFVIRLGTTHISHETAAILEGAAAPAVRLFVRRNKEYGDSAVNLGPKGQFSDIHRKVMKLKNIIWDEMVAPEDITESPEEILMDLIGHCLLGIHMLQESPLKYGTPVGRNASGGLGVEVKTDGYLSRKAGTA